MYPSHTLYRPPQRRKGYFLPFLSLIILGLIVVLVFQMVDYFQEQHLKKLENKAAVTVLAGKAEMKIWGVDEWADAPSGSILHEGDFLRTAPGSRIVMTLLNGSIVRLASETEVEIEALKTRDNQDELGLIVHAGEVWLQRAEPEIVRASFTVNTPHMRIFSLGTIFDVAAEGMSESVRVLDGKVRVEILAEDQSKEGGSLRTAETLEVALGQEITLGAGELTALRDRRPIDLLALLSDSFRNDEWYAWNRSEDAHTADTVTVADAVEHPLAKEPVTPVEEPAPVQLAAALTSPKILTPTEDKRVIKTSQVVITGEASSATHKLEVTTFREGRADPYLLQKYSSGATSWSYVASSAYGNLTPGENRFEFRAIGKDGTKSEPARITITYDIPVEKADLSAPQVSAVDGTALDAGQSSFAIEGDTVLLTGSIGKGVIKMVINDFTLTRFVPGSTSWSYYAKTAYGNLKDGDNTYTIYGVDAAGTQTGKLTFVIKKKAQSPQAQPATPAPAATPKVTPPPAPSNENVPL